MADSRPIPCDVFILYLRCDVPGAKNEKSRSPVRAAGPKMRNQDQNDQDQNDQDQNDQDQNDQGRQG